MILTPGPSDLPATADLVVVGGGIVGAATAFYASRAGLRTVVLEARPGLATLTTTRSLECFRAQWEEPENVAMMRESIAVFERFAEVLGLPGYDVSLRQQGYLFVTTAEDGPVRLASRVAAQRAMGLEDVEYLDGDEARRRFPYLSPGVKAATFRARDGWLATHEATHGFAAASGARFFVETEVVGFRIRERRLHGVETSRGRVDAPHAAIAAGPFSGRVAALAGLRPPLTPLRRHRAGVKAHPLVPRWAPLTLSLETGAHWRPEGPGAFLGWASAFDEPPDEPRERVPADWTFPARVIDAVSRETPFWDEIARRLTRSNLSLEAGQYTMTPDAKPLIGPSAVEGLYLNAGYSGHGVMGSPAGARILVDLIVGRLKDAENPFSPWRVDVRGEQGAGETMGF